MEFLNGIKVSGTPNHIIELKVGVRVPIMLMRNINPSSGLCNGTRLVVAKMTKNIFGVEILTCTHLGKKVPIYRIATTCQTSGQLF